MADAARIAGHRIAETYPQPLDASVSEFTAHAR